MKRTSKYIVEYLAKKRSKIDRHTGEYVGCTLTEQDVYTLLDEAGITLDDIGKKAHEYQLARYDDTGPYEMGNCRFVTMRENMAERSANDFSAVARQRQAEAWTPERREAQAEKMRAGNSPETREKMSLAKKGKPWTQARRDSYNRRYGK